MDVELRHLRVLAIVDASGFTGAAAELGLSQPAVSRTLAALEDALGVRLLRRTSREFVLTAAGERVLARARRVLAEVDDLVREARGGHGRIDGALVGLESRYCALAADDPPARRRYLRLADLADRVLAVDPRTGTTTLDLWPLEGRPAVEEIHDVDDWLAVIATGRCVGVTAESTLSQDRRDGVVFRRVRDASPVPVRLVWRRDDPHPATRDVVGLLAELYGRARAPVVQ
ncbi:LysR family transcriptional regulator [Pseudonocardia charpentierae]|uniref:LysR family transcriptional regulator n=1 Tax=Pseudonocardia charpentierae TaxID=3075545 RepID=A0ABU2N2S5_9PSEU|nr:LysR family transcriptional regulator [Pseudonocardia sp. DSM 45834]MDT0348221.1 LysR family transcriptional regulator [Pseudonocardia sp. DSM 45834]